MTRMDLRLQAWTCSTTKAVSLAGRTDDQVIAMQKRQMPAGADPSRSGQAVL
jgi:hypothetical protein